MKQDKYGRRFVYDDHPEPDDREGHYYVSCIDGPRTALLAGPFSSHTQALAKVEAAKTAAQEVDSKAFWYAFGTCRMEAVPYGWKVGILNERLGLPLHHVITETTAP
ncbi:MAG TPA: hypothetical protein VIV15_03640 [Anaerolineales bacterium]